MALQAYLSIAQLGLGLFKAGAEIETAKSQRRADELAIFNNDTDGIRLDAQTLQRHNDRAEEYRVNKSVNTASFTVGGQRDVFDSQSVKAFLKRNMDVLDKDLERSDFMGNAEASLKRQQSMVMRQEAGARLNAAYTRAFTSTVGSIMDYSKTRVPKGKVTI